MRRKSDVLRIALFSTHKGQARKAKSLTLLKISGRIFGYLMV